MDKIMEALQVIFNGIDAGTDALDLSGKGTVDYGTAAQKIASGTDFFAGAIKTIINFFTGLFNLGSVK